jgi:uncharacterized protein YodC (DUF2158 family)
MTFKAGDVVMLKSGGQALTVAAVDDDTVECVWLGEEGDLFRESLPAAVLDHAEIEHDDEDELSEDASDDDAEDGEATHKSEAREVA